MLLTLNLVGCGGSDSSSSGSDIATETSMERKNPLKYVELITPSGEVIKSSLAYKPADQQQGLSGVKPEDFSDDEGKLFFYFTEATRRFWMPDTYFALDIFYLDENLKIEEIVWNLPAYQGDVNADIPRAPAVRSRHVLEMKTGSVISSRLKVGDQLTWKSSVGLDEIESLMNR